jgi:Flp pilus assembly pilin Flp
MGVFKRESSRLSRVGQNLLACRCGANAIEFALLAPVIVVLIMGGLQFGYILHMENQVYAIAQNGARKLALQNQKAVETEVWLRSELGALGNNAMINIDEPGATRDAVVAIEIDMKNLIFVSLFDNFVDGSKLHASATFPRLAITEVPN